MRRDYEYGLNYELICYTNNDAELPYVDKINHQACVILADYNLAGASDYEDDSDESGDDSDDTSETNDEGNESDETGYEDNDDGHENEDDHEDMNREDEENSGENYDQSDDSKGDEEEAAQQIHNIPASNQYIADNIERSRRMTRSGSLTLSPTPRGQ